MKNDNLVSILKKLLSKTIKDIDDGNTNLTEEEMNDVVEFLQKVNLRERYISKYQAFTHLNMSRAKFDNLVREGILPRGKKVEGFKELQWSLKEIKDVKKKEQK